jgi:hypothetical protein
VVAELVRELVVQGAAVGVQPLEVLRAELDGEVVRHQPAVPGQDPGGVVDLAFERGGELDRLDVALERAREDPAHDALQAPFEALQRSHASSSTSVVGWRQVSTNDRARRPAPSAGTPYVVASELAVATPGTTIDRIGRFDPTRNARVGQKAC